MTEAQMTALLQKVEAVVKDSEQSREEIRAGIADLGVRLTKLETRFDGGIITVDLCREKERAMSVRISAEEEARKSGDAAQKERLDGHVLWMRLIAVGLVVAMAGAILAVALR